MTDTTTAVGRCLIATWPCGCMGAVTSLSFGLSPRDQANFYRENVEDGAQVENVTTDEYKARGGVVLCRHDPQWGGIESKFDTCDQCNKRVQKRRDGHLRAHKGNFGIPCSGTRGDDQ